MTVLQFDNMRKRRWLKSFHLWHIKDQDVLSDVTIKSFYLSYLMSSQQRGRLLPSGTSHSSGGTRWKVQNSPRLDLGIWICQTGRVQVVFFLCEKQKQKCVCSRTNFWKSPSRHSEQHQNLDGGISSGYERWRHKIQRTGSKMAAHMCTTMDVIKDMFTFPPFNQFPMLLLDINGSLYNVTVQNHVYKG